LRDRHIGLKTKLTPDGVSGRRGNLFSKDFVTEEILAWEPPTISHFVQTPNRTRNRNHKKTKKVGSSFAVGAGKRADFWEYLFFFVAGSTNLGRSIRTERGSRGNLPRNKAQRSNLGRNCFFRNPAGRKEGGKLIEQVPLIESSVGFSLSLNFAATASCIRETLFLWVRTYPSAREAPQRPRRSGQSEGKEARQATQLGMAVLGLCSVQKSKEEEKKRGPSPFSSSPFERDAAGKLDEYSLSLTWSLHRWLQSAG